HAPATGAPQAEGGGQPTHGLLDPDRPSPAVALLPAGQVAVDQLGGEGQARGEALQDSEERVAGALSRRQGAEPAEAHPASARWACNASAVPSGGTTPVHRSSLAKPWKTSIRSPAMGPAEAACAALMMRGLSSPCTRFS